MILRKGGWLVVPVIALAGVGVAQAQLDGLLDAVKSKSTQAVEQQVEQRFAFHASPQAAGSRPMLRVSGGFDFASTPAGAMPRGWKTNGSGQVVSVQGFPGKWLELGAGSIYKLSRTRGLPNAFTVSFDLLPVADRADDLNSPIFGFAKNDSVASYLNLDTQGEIINSITLYFGSDNVSLGSNATAYSASPNFAFSNYTNRVLHVSIAVNGDFERVYFDHAKVVDAELFLNNPSRYFSSAVPQATIMARSCCSAISASAGTHREVLPVRRNRVAARAVTTSATARRWPLGWRRRGCTWWRNTACDCASSISCRRDEVRRRT